MTNLGGISVSVSLTRSSSDFLIAFARLVASIENADPALLDVDVAEAHADLKRVLQGGNYLAFEEET